MDNKTINGGYYLKAKQIQESEIAIAPPHVREIWDWILLKANYKDRKINGTTIKRGQLLTTYNDVIEGLKWKIGFRTMRYTKWQCEKAMKILRKLSMVTTVKTTRGMIITVCKYDIYQNPINYESHSENHNESFRSPQGSHTIHNELNEGKGKKEESSPPPPNYFMEGENQEHIKTAKDVLDYFNRKFNKNIKYDSYGNRTIFDRLIEGYLKEQLIYIIDTKSKDPHFLNKRNLYRPTVLFSSKNINEFLDENPNHYEKPKKEDIPLSANVGRGIIDHSDFKKGGKLNP